LTPLPNLRAVLLRGEGLGGKGRRCRKREKCGGTLNRWLSRDSKSKNYRKGRKRANPHKENPTEQPRLRKEKDHKRSWRFPWV